MKLRCDRVLVIVSLCLLVATGCAGESSSGGDDITFTQISSSGGRVAWYKGSAGHELIAYDAVVDNSTAATELFTMNPDGSSVNNLTGGNDDVPSGFVGQPAWHPYGEYILFQVENDNSQHMRYNHLAWGINNDLWIIKRDGSGAERIWKTPLNHAALHAHFNADGTKIIFAERESTGQILYSPFLTPGGENPWAGWRIHIADFSMNASGTSRLSNHLTLFDADAPENRGFFETHAFLDENTIIFSRTLDGQSYVDDIFTSDLQGNNLVNLTQSPSTWEEHGLFSPSGKTLAFISSRVNPDWQAPSDTAVNLRTELYMLKSSVLEQVTNFNQNGDPDKRYLVSDYEWDSTGRRIALQVAPVDDVTGSPYSPEIWTLTFPKSQ